MKIATTRAETLSDGVIAIILTIMVLEMMPELAGDSGEEEVVRNLQKLVPNLIAYIGSFTMIGIFWMNHHHMFHLLEKIDEPLLLLNLLFLFCMSLIPMATSVLGAKPFLSTSSALYGIVMLMTTLAFTIMRVHADRKNLMHKDQDKKLMQRMRKLSIRAKTKNLIGTFAYLLAIGLAFVNVYFSFACFLIPPAIFFIPDGIDDEKLAEKIADKK
ncbi:MAG TPA: TMEM175 family protein [Chryseosolibacter sp.]|nr:TMEM175 family protein [Chryseosolibacter sp.]